MPTSGWLKAGIAAFIDGVSGVSGRIIMPLPHNKPTDYEYNASHLEQSEFMTANCFYRRSFLQRVGGFDERFTAPWREDSDLFFTLISRLLAAHNRKREKTVICHQALRLNTTLILTTAAEREHVKRSLPVAKAKGLSVPF